MKKEVPIRFEESEQYHITDITWEEVKESHKSKDTVVNTSITQVIIWAIVLFMISFILWIITINAFVDTGLQDSVNKITQAKKQIWTDQQKIQQFNKDINTQTGIIDKNNNILRDKYKLNVQ